ncbi:hypothetical protein SUGI_1125800 [Cryptomeria japonica]|uniref:uncharacterized protein LOC131037599 n=1 Tax=Cryptomeria japonica TaxID=3369 RepID=UPI0024147065|nr:uncharacterized protein LOC131037599 [Cryptomeria japonica]GLJ52847.1 hypothetical protein SUGI_1125800 [Cryptomeria japonica]
MEFWDLILREEEAQEAHQEMNEEVAVLMERLEEEISVDHPLSTLSSSSSYCSSYSCANCCVQSDSAFSMSSSSSRLSSQLDCELKCRCHEKNGVGLNGYVSDELGYLLGASDEELGIPTDNTNSNGNYIGVLGESFLASANSTLGFNTEVGDLDMWEMGSGEYYSQPYYGDDNYCFADIMTEIDTELTLQSTVLL